MKTTLILSAFVLALLFTGCEKEGDMKTSSMFNVSIENVMVEKDFLSSGVFNAPVGATGFMVTIHNLEGSTTPIAPGVWVVHSMDNPLFEVGMADFGSGLKGLAEDGDPSGLAGHITRSEDRCDRERDFQYSCRRIRSRSIASRSQL